MQAFKLSKPPKGKPPPKPAPLKAKDEVKPTGINQFAAVCASAAAVSAAKAAAAAVSQGSAGLAGNAAATSFLGRAAVQSSKVETEVAAQKPKKRGGLSAAAMAAMFLGEEDPESQEEAKPAKKTAAEWAAELEGKGKSKKKDIEEVEEDSKGGALKFVWDAEVGALVDADKATSLAKKKDATDSGDPGIHGFVGGASDSEDDASSASSSGDEATGPCPVILPDGNVELSENVTETTLSVSDVPDVGAGLEMRWKRGYGLMVKKVEPDPGQERLRPGDIIVSIGGEALCQESEDATAAVFKKHLKHGASIRVQLGLGGDQKIDKAAGAQSSKALDAASTPELMAQAAAAGLTSMSDRWVFDKTSKLNFYRSNGSGITYCWNQDQGYMHRWVSRGKMEFLWAGRNPLPGAPKPPPPQDEDGNEKEASKTKTEKSKAPPTDSNGTAKAKPAPANADDSGERALWITVIPPSLLYTSAEKIEAVVELPKRALKGWGGKKGQERMDEIGKQSGAVVTKEQRTKLEMPKKQKDKDKDKKTN
eukprot:gnl/MRDRNA2_/MRDRNA2_33763_c0_seq1.p1 gnl/MRDRNA2_/MRDRNA2_33763_c0~~gnl/MRDRNA2_/MRDRNA2_33763_c0_seq1.p1  ORF type:complete len:536 (+),score=171.44 gnl/MRDRNA2_/MRDRNA2_33763_c0_seq1:63-1670(+)